VRVLQDLEGGGLAFGGHQRAGLSDIVEGWHPVNGCDEQPPRCAAAVALADDSMPAISVSLVAVRLMGCDRRRGVS
jgi:hypothetical protein